MSDFTIPEAAVEAAADALHADACPEDMQDCMCGDFEREARVALEAALPLIRDALAEQVAGQKIMPIHGTFLADGDQVRNRVIDQAARIVRGEQS